jgi:hypothetical protein
MNDSFGASISSPEIAQILNNTKAPYNISSISAQIAESALSPEGKNSFNARNFTNAEECEGTDGDSIYSFDQTTRRASKSGCD